MTYRISKSVLGVKIHDISEKEALDRVVSYLKGQTLKRSDLKKVRPFLIVTPGPEFLLTAQKDKDFRKILNSADLSLPDGFGLHFAGINHRVPGTDFMVELCRLAAKNKLTIGLLGGQTGVAKRAAEKLKEKFPGIKIAAAIDGQEADQILMHYDRIKKTKNMFDMLFVAFGHPQQEKLLWKLKISNFKFQIGVGVGGAFDYIAGQAIRPPKWVQVIGFEWFWRLVLQPWRWRRILKAFFVFPIVLLLNRGKIRS